MSLDDLKGAEVARGAYLYGGISPKRVSVIARNYDVRWSTLEADGLLEDGEQPAVPGPDGLYYYVSATGPFKKSREAKAWAEQAGGPIKWGR